MLRFLPKLNFRIIIYLLVLVFVGATGVAMHIASHASLWENLFSSSVEILLTVGVLDMLINKDKYQRYKNVNKTVSVHVRQRLLLSMFELAKAIEPSDESFNSISIFDYSPKQIRHLVQQFIDSQTFNSYFTNLENPKTDLSEQVEPVLKTIQGCEESIRKCLSDVQPYLKHSVHEVFWEQHNQIIAEIIAMVESYKFTYQELPKRVRLDNNNRKLLNSVAPQEFFLHSAPSGRGYKNNLQKILNDYALVLEAAYNNNLHEII